MNDVINHPEHYTNGSVECLDIMIETQGSEAVKSYCLCNAFKYLWRWQSKNGVEDIYKARFYLNKYLELYEEEHCTDVPDYIRKGWEYVTS